MTGAMYAAIGGLKTHMTKLNVIGNNLANVNTYGYKAQRMTFRESIYGTNKSGSNGTATMGGNNPSQIGYGCTVGSIDLNMSPSTYSPTGYGLDCMLTGEGFFLVGNKVNYIVEDENGEGDNATKTRSIEGTGITKASGLTEPYLTRVGDFWVDADGYICNRDNQVLYGFARVQNPHYVPEPTSAQLKWAEDNKINIVDETIISTELVPLRVPLSAAAPTEANKGLIKADGIATNPFTGEVLEEDLYLWSEGDPVYPYLNANQENRYSYWDDTEYQNNTGGLVQTVGSRDYTATDGSISAIYASQIAVGHNQGENAVSGELPVQMRGMQVGKDGSITGTVNGKTVVIGYIAVASADSPDGVTNAGGPYYKAQGGAGNLRVNALVDLDPPYLGNQRLTDDFTPSAADRIMNDTTNSIQNGGLEASSTDVATEFAEMITAQRGYQVNTRIVSVTDSMLEELANMKR